MIDVLFICILLVAVVYLVMSKADKQEETPVLVDVEYDENCPYLLKKAHDDDACWDIYLPESVELRQNSSILSSGFRIALPKGYFAFVLPRSGNSYKGMPVVSTTEGMAKEKRIHVDVEIGTIDSGFTNVVGVIIRNHYRNVRGEQIFIKGGTRVAQLMILKLPNVALNMVESIDRNTERGEGGFGSTGK